ncbi:calmodulin-binding transcription activator 4-like isoform X1 [Sesamum indicum]|uniref:Calmodulin-binding transcription activator 4-like isoform X1 n=2 Tax=Sesamum indicum TaxID=4182 RepID=A0A6I9SV26_SESIN|nr:calmodulin-binding transcription activator 4-like isoform X1 [Sesamum indicum]
MMQSGYDINHLVREAQTRWLKPVEVFLILQNYEEHQLTHQIPQKPPSGSLYLFNKQVLRFFRKDGHRWRRRRDQRTIAEAHERLKVGNVEALNCYYAHGEENSNFQRRSYWMLDPKYEHIVLVHYRDIGAGKQNAGSTSQFSTFCSSAVNPSHNSLPTQQPDSSFDIGESYELNHNQSSPSSVEISSSQMKDPVPNHFDIIERTDEVSSSSVPDLSRALRRIEQQLSLNDEEVEEMKTFYVENEDSNDLEDVLCDYELSGQTPNVPDLLPEQSELGAKPKAAWGVLMGHDFKGDGVQQRHQLPAVEVDIWNEVLYSSQKLPNLELQTKLGAEYAILSSLQHVDSQKYHAYSSVPHAYGTTQHYYSSLFDQDGSGTSLESNISLTCAQKQKFTIREISPDWCYSSEGAKIIIIGSFLSDPSECAWACMIGDSEVPVQIIQEGVLCCHSPPHFQGKVNICITSGNQESCSEVREFEYRAKPNVCTHSNLPKTEVNKSSEELLLLVRFVQMLLSDLLPKGDVSRSRINLLGKSRMSEDSWSQIIDSLLVGTSTSSSTLDWLLQELLKDKLEVWLSCKLQKNNLRGCSLSKKEQGIIHMAAGLGLEWALKPVLNSGVSINFRDINGWTALHWAARFGREKMVAALIASGASAGAVTDPNSQDPTGKTAAAIAATWGHMGLAGYLSEVALTSHLSSLTLEESELSKGSAAVEAERTVNSLSKESSSSNEDQVFLKHTLAAVRNSAQAAARIQSAFRAHSFRKRQQREAAVAIGDAVRDEYCILAHNIRRISEASKLAFRNVRDYNSAALSIQKKYRGWKGRKDFLAFRQKVVKIQAHVRGYQVRKNSKVCWAVGILDKVILRWRRRGVGLRGFRHDSESIDESEDEDILKVFRKQKVDAAIDEAVSRVLSMVESPDARQQYHRILEKYRQAKAELESAESDTASSSAPHISSYQGVLSHMENDEITS